MKSTTPFDINNFQQTHQLPCEGRACAEAVCKLNTFTYTTISKKIELTASHYVIKLTAMTHDVDLIATQINFPDKYRFILTTISRYYRVLYNDLAMFLTIGCYKTRRPFGFGRRNDCINDTTRELQSFRRQSRQFQRNLPRRLNLEVRNYLSEQTTLSSSFIDLNFFGFMHLICKPYFSLHLLRFLCNSHNLFNFCNSFNLCK